MTEPCKHPSVVTYRSHPAHSVCDMCEQVVQKVWVAADQVVTDAAALEGLDRHARAYGWEVGRGADIGESITEMSTGNPFAYTDWRMRAGLSGTVEP